MYWKPQPEFSASLQNYKNIFTNARSFNILVLWEQTWIIFRMEYTISDVLSWVI